MVEHFDIAVVAAGLGGPIFVDTPGPQRRGIRDSHEPARWAAARAAAVAV